MRFRVLFWCTKSCPRENIFHYQTDHVSVRSWKLFFFWRFSPSNSIGINTTFLGFLFGIPIVVPVRIFSIIRLIMHQIDPGKCFFFEDFPQAIGINTTVLGFIFGIPSLVIVNFFPGNVSDWYENFFNFFPK
jgi:hypothetical protein